MKHSKFYYSKHVKIFLIAAATIYVFLCILLFCIQDRLLFPLAFHQSEDEAVATVNSDTTESIDITMSDDCTLHGYFLHSAQPESGNLLLYFGANAEDVTLLTDKMSRFQDWSILLMQYRGYGDSEGKPCTDKLYQDSLELYDYITNRPDTTYQTITIMGRSIGTSVATYLASKRKNSDLILVSPFDTLTHVVQMKCPILPVHLLLKNKFESIKYAPAVTSPVYFLVGTKDWLVPTSLSKKLAQKFSSPVSYKEITGVGHNTIDDVDVYWDSIQTILDQAANNLRSDNKKTN